MNRSLFRAAACTLAAVAATLALLAVPASSPSQAASFTFSDPNCSSFSFDGSTLTCNTSTPNFSCSISTSNSAPTVSSTVTLTANCSGAAGSVSYTWTLRAGSTAGCPTTTSTTSQAILTAPNGTAALSCIYDLSANDTVTTLTPSKTVSYTTGGGGGGGGGGTTDTSACTAAGLTPIVIPLSWANQTVYTANYGGFGANTAVVVKFTTPATIPAGTGKGYFQAAEFQSSPSARTGSLSANPCEFGSSSISSAGAFTNNPAPLIYFKLPGSTKAGVSLQANTTYYFNIMNPPGSTCSSQGCDMIITMSKPSGS